jgi:uncharacterized protein (TIGR02145 family)
MKRQDYIKATQAAIINQPKYWAKHHNDRVTTDGGTVTDTSPVDERSYLTDEYKFLRENKLIDNLIFSWSGYSGVNERISGINRYITKAYNLIPIKYSVDNLIVNGDFRNGNTNAYFANASLVDGWAKIDPPIGVAAAAGLDAPITLGDIYYGRTLIKFNTSLNKGANKSGWILFRTEHESAANWGTPNFSERSAGDIITFSNREVISDARSIRLILSLYHPTEITSASVKDLILINLTQTFGAGNEPNKEQCDLLFTNYFEGTKEVSLSTFNDATQTAEANQPFAGGGIAPNEKRRLKNMSNISTLEIKHQKISFTTTDTWSVTTVLKMHGNSTTETVAYCGESGTTNAIYLLRDGNRTGITSSTNAGKTYAIDQLELLRSNFGKKIIITWIYTANNLLCYINGVQFPIIVSFEAFPFAFDVLFWTYLTNQRKLNGEIYHHQIFNKALSASEVQAQHAYLRLQHPEIEGINIGNQHWATSNCVLGATGNGTAIPEVQQSTSTEVISNEVDRDFTDNTGYWSLGAGWSIVGGKLVFSGSVAANASKLGVMTYAPKIYKVTLKVDSISGLVVFASSDFSNSLSERTIISGTNTYTLFSQSNNFFIAAAIGASIEIDSISIKEVGWADLTTPAWCYYNNDPLNGAVYGKLYNWYAVQAIAANPPSGWRVPTQADFIQLINFLGGASVAGGKMKKEGLTYWSSPNVGATNESGLTVLGGGKRAVDGTFDSLKENGYLHSQTAAAGYFVRNFTNELIFASFEYLNRGYPIRLIRNEPVGATERNIETGYITNALGATNLDISIPFGYRVDSIKFESATNITGISAKLRTTEGTDLETLFSAESISAGVSKTITAATPQTIQQTDPTVRINGTKADVNAVFTVSIYLTKVVFS